MSSLSGSVKTKLDTQLRYYELYDIDKEKLEEIAAQRESELTFSWVFGGKEYLIELQRNDELFAPDFRVVAGSKKNALTVDYQGGAYYHGQLKGIDNSLVAISFFGNSIVGVISSPYLGNVNIGLLPESENTATPIAIAYQETAAIDPPDFNCETTAEASETTTSPISKSLLVNTLCFSSYLELDHALYLENNSSVQESVDFITGAFNVVAIIYDNEEITSWISEVFVWTTPDNYPTNDSSVALEAFKDAIENGFNGDLAHLISRNNNGLGGYAWINVVCNTNPRNKVAYSNINSGYSDFPSYSWTINVLTHEIGHNLGSLHTHDCVWNGNNTQIDDCGNQWLNEPNNCFDENSPILPPNGSGTIMSYCHLNGTGIGFNEGFGSQPGDLIRARLLNCSNCQNTCEIPTGIEITSIGYSHFQFNWDNSTTVTTNIRYRETGTTTWVELFDYANGTHISTTREPCTEYEWQIQGVCEDGELSEWSESFTLTTEGCDDNYCYNYGLSFDHWITRVGIAEIDNTSGNGYGYDNFTDQTAELLGDESYTMTLRSATNVGSQTVFWSVWIDLNRDNDFLDAGELVLSTTSTSDQTITPSFIMPNDINDGFTRVRVAMSPDGALDDPCQTGDPLDVEDYTAYIEGISVEELTITPEQVFFSALGGTENITVSSNVEWSVTESVDWFSVSPESGIDNGNFVITCDANPNTVSRTATITVTGGGLTRTVTVEQSGLIPILLVDPDEAFFSALGGTENITVSSNVEWSVTESVDWFSVSPESGIDNGNFVITCDANPNTVSRTATITVTGGGLTRTVTVEQSGLIPILLVDPDEAFFSALGGTENITVSSNVEWSVTESVDWFSVSPESGIDNGNFVITCDANPNTVSRTATITVTGGGLTRTVTVEQSGLIPILLVDPDEAFFSALGGTENITVSSNVEWSVTESADWFSVSPESGIDNGNFVITCDANPNTVSRTATITVTGGGLTRTVNVVQAGLTPILEVNPENVFFDVSGGTEEIEVESNIDWTITVDATWLSTSVDSGTENGNFIIDCNPNGAVQTRTGTITLMGGGITRTVIVEQEGLVLFLDVDPEIVFANSSEGNEEISVNSNVFWTVNEGSDWLTVSPDNGNDDGSFIIDYETNAGAQNRIAVITINGDGNLSRTVTVEQAGAEPFLSVNPTVVGFNSAGGNQNVSVGSNVSWMVTEISSWFDVNPSSGNGNGGFTITCQLNPNLTVRTETIIVTTNDGLSQTITVEQSGTAPQLSANPEEVFFTAIGGEREIAVSSNVNWTVNETASWLDINTQGGSGNGSFIIECEENESTQGRTAIITLSGNGITFLVTVEQLGSSPLLEVNPDYVFFDIPGGIETVVVTSNVGWLATESSSWFSLTTPSGSGDGNFGIVCSNYVGTVSRIGTITVTSADGSTIATVTVEQAGAAPFLSANPDNLFFDVEGGTEEININTNIGWSISEGSSWLSLSAPAGNGSGAVTVTCSENFTTDIRSGTITLTGDNGQVILIEVSQAGASPYLEVNQDFVYFDPAGGSDQLELSSNVNWIITTSESWVSVDPLSGSGSLSLFIDCNVNNGPDTRTASFSILGGGETATFIVEQFGTSIFCVDSETTIGSTICAGESVTIGDNTYTETGSFENLFQTEDGCDSLIILNLDVISLGGALPTALSTCAGIPATLFAPAGLLISLPGGSATNSLSLLPGTYTIQLESPTSGCQAEQTVNVIEDGNLTVSISGERQLCGSETTILTVSGGTTYQWSGGTTPTDTSNELSAGEYSLTVSDDQGCSTVETITINSDISAPQFVSCPDNQEVQLTAGQTSVVVNWPAVVATDNCGNVGITINESHPSGASFDLGTTTVSYTATDEAGLSANCEFTVSILGAGPSPELTFYVDTLDYTQSGDTICATIRVLNFVDVGGFQFSVELADLFGSSLDTILAVSPLTGLDGGVGGLLVDQVNEHQAQLIWLNGSGEGITLEDNSAILQVKFLVTENAPGGSCIPLAITGDPLFIEAFVEGEGAVTPLVINGDICFAREYVVNGKVYRIDEQPVAQAALSLIGADDTRLDTTDVAGRYGFENVMGGADYRLVPERDFNDVEGLSVLDMIRILRHIQGISPIENPYLLMAADVNRSQSISVADILEVRELILGNLSAFMTHTSWFFVPVSYSFPEPTNPWAETVPEEAQITDLDTDELIDFYGIKTGDINLSNDGQNLTSGNMLLSYADRQYAPGELLEVVLYANDFDQLSGFQLALRTSDLEIVAIQPSAATEAAGTLTFSRANWLLGEVPLVFLREHITESSTTELPVLTMRLRAKAAGRLSEQLSLAPSLLPNEAFDGELSPLSIELTPARLTNASDLWEANTSALMRLQPNPFREALQLEFYLSQATEVNVQLLDAQGRVVYTQTTAAAAGTATISLIPKNALIAGLYFCRWQTEHESGVVRVVRE